MCLYPINSGVDDVGFGACPRGESRGFHRVSSVDHDPGSSLKEKKSKRWTMNLKSAIFYSHLPSKNPGSCQCLFRVTCQLNHPHFVRYLFLSLQSFLSCSPSSTSHHSRSDSSCDSEQSEEMLSAKSSPARKLLSQFVCHPGESLATSFTARHAPYLASASAVVAES